MLSQGELNFYGYNPNNIISRMKHGKITVIIKYDSINKCYVIRRETPKTIIIERTTDKQKAVKLSIQFLYTSYKRLGFYIKYYGSYIPY
jgi:hypothetical protein